MNSFVTKSLMAAFLGCSSTVFAGEYPCDPKTQYCPPPKVTADCSPGFYKKHPDTWDSGICAVGQHDQAGTQANQLFLMLSAELGATAAQRQGAKSFLDSCFGTAVNSPCEDDD